MNRPSTIHLLALFLDDDDPDLDLSTTTAWYFDGDFDGYGLEDEVALSCQAPEGYIRENPGGFACVECDDDFDVNPDATELCQNDIDENCDGVYSEGCTSIFLDCGGDGAMDVGETFHCTIGSTVPVDLIYISVGCNDGETGSFSFVSSGGWGVHDK